MPVTDTVIRHAKPSDPTYKFGLYLRVSPGGSKRWYLRYSFENRDFSLALVLIQPPNTPALLSE